MTTTSTESVATSEPRWWLDRLESELARRLPEMQRFRDLVDDVHPGPDSTERSQSFRRIAGLVTTNLTGLAVEATGERITVEGIRIGDEPDADKDIWDNIWQRSDFDEGSQEATTGALVYSRSFVSVEPPNGSSDYSKLHYEDPRQVVVAYAPNGRTKVAALKLFTDEWTGTTFGTFYTPDLVVRMERVGTPGLQQTYWVPRVMPRDGDAITANPIGEIPFFELQNRLTGSVRSEVAPLETPQRRLNQLMFNIDAVAEYGAFRQKWVTGIELPIDPTTGEKVAPFNAKVSNLFTSEDPDTSFGDFNPTDLAGYLSLADKQVQQIATIARIPAIYFQSSVSNVGSETLAALMSSLVLKCQRRVKGYEPAFENAVRLALRLQGDARANTANIEVKWADMETRSKAQDADAAVKLTTGDNPIITPQTAQEKYLGLTQTERDRDDAWRAEGGASGDVAAILAAAAEGGPAPTPVDDAATIKAKADALGALIRSGADPVSAAEMLGLPGLKFTGAVPVSLRLPESDAATLEQQ